MTAIYTHRTLKDPSGAPESHCIGGVDGLAKAWNLLDFAAGRMGWNPETVNEQVKVEVK